MSLEDNPVDLGIHASTRSDFISARILTNNIPVSLVEFFTSYSSVNVCIHGSRMAANQRPLTHHLVANLVLTHMLKIQN